MKKRVILFVNRSVHVLPLYQIWILSAQYFYRRAHRKDFSILFSRIPERKEK